jgi:hypothetical protein
MSRAIRQARNFTAEIEPVAGLGRRPRFRHDENAVFPSERQEELGLTRDYFSLLHQCLR